MAKTSLSLFSKIYLFFPSLLERVMESLKEIGSTISHNKLRTVLTGFSVAWGIFMLIFLLGAGNGLINATQQNSGDFLDRSMVVSGDYTTKPYNGLKEGRKIDLREKDLTTTEQKFGGHVDQVAGKCYANGMEISLGDNYISTTLDGVYPIEQRINNRKLRAGRFINDIDIRERRKVLVLTHDQAKELARDPESLVGRTVKVGDLAFLVIGITESTGSGFGENADIPFTTMRAIYREGDWVDNIYFTFHGLETEQDNEAFEKSYRSSLAQNHDFAPDDEGAVWIWNRFTQALQMDQGMGIIRTALWIIGIFTLLSGIVGVSNIMLITVKERTHEFGIRKAIGATPGSLLRLIITESVIITTFFGYIGMLAGMAANQYMNVTAGQQTIDAGPFQVAMFVNPTVGFDVCVEATLVMVVAGTCAGLIPARKAARIRPIEALREE